MLTLYWPYTDLILTDCQKKLTLYWPYINRLSKKNNLILAFCWPYTDLILTLYWPYTYLILTLYCPYTTKIVKKKPPFLIPWLGPFNNYRWFHAKSPPLWLFFRLKKGGDLHCIFWVRPILAKKGGGLSMISSTWL